MSDDIQQQLLKSIARDPRISMRLARKLRSAGREVPDIIFDSIINHELLGGDFAQELAEDYVLNHEKVPQILLNKVSESGKNSFYLAKYYAFHDQQIPDQLLKSIENSNFAGLPIREKDWNNKSEEEETTPQSEFMKTFYKKILNTPGLSLRYAEKLIENDRSVPEELEDAIIKNREDVEYALTLMDHDKPLSNKLVESIATNFNQSLAVALAAVKLKKIIPEVIFKVLLESSDNSTEYAIAYMKEGFKDPNILKRLENGIFSGKYNGPEDISENAGNYAIVYTRMVGENPSERIVAASKPKNLVPSAINLLYDEKQPSIEMINKIATNETSSFTFVKQYQRIFGKKTLPSIYKPIKISAQKYEASHI